jgi:hypothetical protein
MGQLFFGTCQRCLAHDVQLFYAITTATDWKVGVADELDRNTMVRGWVCEDCAEKLQKDRRSVQSTLDTGGDGANIAS